MARKNDRSRPPGTGTRRVTLKTLAKHLNLSPATVSVVLNRSPVADAIPRETQERVFAAARELDYRPNYLARTLRGKRSFSVGVLVPEISEGYAAGVMSGIEDHLVREGYFYLMASHRSRPDLMEEYLNHLEDRSVEGFVLIAGNLQKPPRLPTVVVSGHQRLAGLTNVTIDHDRAARLALTHLAELGHRRIAFFQGAHGNVDAEDRWHSIRETAAALDLEIRPELALQLVAKSYGAVFSPQEGYQEGYDFGRKLLARSAGSSRGGGPGAARPPFTALFAFNDISAIGAMRAFLDAGLRIPEDVSVVGFDDIQSAAFQNPSLTTVRQPLHEMGETAARILLARLEGKNSHPDFVTVEPELVVRQSTGPPPAGPRQIAREPSRPHRAAAADRAGRF